MREEGRSSGRATNHRTARAVPDERRGDVAPESTELHRKAVALCPFIDDDWPEYRRALPRMKEEQVLVAWLLRWGRSRDQIADITGMGLSTVKNHAAYLRDRLEGLDCRDIGPKASSLVNLLRVTEGRLTLELREKGGRVADEAPARPERGRRARPTQHREGGARAPPPA